MVHPKVLRVFGATALLASYLAACQPTPPPASPTAPSVAATSAVSPAASLSPAVAKPSPAAGASPSASPSPQARTGPGAGTAAASTQDGKAEWDRWVAAAKQEGRVTVSGNNAAVWRDSVTALWKQEYPEIEIEYSGFDGRNFWPRVNQERQVGQFLWDLRVGGAEQEAYEHKGEWFDPIRAVMLLPEVADESKWFGGLDGLFSDRDNKYFTGFAAYTSKVGDINRDAIPATELRHVRELLDAKWKGKIVLQDPRGGSGLAMLTVLLAGMGEGFVRDLLTKQEVIVTDDSRQMAEWVVRGRYPIGLGTSTSQLNSFKEQGLQFNLDQIPEGPISLNMGAGGLLLLNKAPHPNAAKVFVNWILTQDTQTKLMQRVGLNSRRVDVPVVDPPTAVELAQAANYVANQEEELLPVRQRAVQIANEILK